jgi:hypothetical protein
VVGVLIEGIDGRHKPSPKNAFLVIQQTDILGGQSLASKCESLSVSVVAWAVEIFP